MPLLYHIGQLSIDISVAFKIKHVFDIQNSILHFVRNEKL